MIEAIGTKRLIILLVLAALTGIFGFLHLYIFAPKAESAQRQTSALRSQIASLRDETEALKTDMTRFRERSIQFKKIEAAGFFNDQSRVLARQRLEEMQIQSKLLAARYEIKRARVVNSERAGKAGYGVLETPITLKLSAIDDMDIYKFIYMLNYTFPGQISIVDMELVRKREVTPEILKEIGLGRPPEILSAELNIEWRTMTKQENLVPAAQDEEEGVQ